MTPPTDTVVEILGTLAGLKCVSCYGAGAQSSLELVGIPGADPMYFCETCQSSGLRFPQLSVECLCLLGEYNSNSIRDHIEDPCGACLAQESHSDYCLTCHGGKRVPLNLESVHLEMVHEAAEVAQRGQYVGLSFITARRDDGYEVRYISDWEAGNEDLIPWHGGKTLVEAALRALDAVVRVNNE